MFANYLLVHLGRPNLYPCRFTYLTGWSSVCTVVIQRHWWNMIPQYKVSAMPLTIYKLSYYGGGLGWGRRGLCHYQLRHYIKLSGLHHKQRFHWLHAHHQALQIQFRMTYNHKNIYLYANQYRWDGVNKC